MKRNILFFMCIIGLFIACESPEATDSQRGKGSAINFQTSITRAVGNQWEVNDSIGIFQVPSGSDFSKAVAVNSPHVTSDGNGTFTGKKPLFYPDGEETTYDFIAYHPYKKGISTRYAIDVSNQTNLNKLDFLYAKTTGQDKSNMNVHLKFKHQLTNLVVEVRAGKDVASLKGLTVALTNSPTQATFDMEKGTLSDGTAIKNIPMKTTVNNDLLSAKAEAIILPSQREGNQLLFKHPQEGTFTYTFGPGSFIAGKKYKLVATLSKEGTIHGVELEGVNSDIEDWNAEDGDMGSIDENFNNGGKIPDQPEAEVGDGTKAKPYSIAQLLKFESLKMKEGVYIQGYVLALVNYSRDVKYPPVTEDEARTFISSMGSKETSLLLADDPYEREPSKLAVTLAAYSKIEDAITKGLLLFNERVKFRIQTQTLNKIHRSTRYETISSGVCFVPSEIPLKPE